MYLISFYACIMEMMGNDILPTTGIEMFMTILGLLLGNLLNAYLFGNIVTLI